MRTRILITLSLVAVFALAAAPLCRAANGHDPDTLKTGAGISIRTNLLWDAVAEPNLGIEIPVGEHVTVGANAGLKAWPRWLAWDWDTRDPKHWRNFAVVPEVRYYFGQIYKGWFAGADFLYTHFNVGAVTTPFHMYPETEEYRVQGSYWAGGLFGGYAWWPWQHWRIELEAGVAAGLAAYDRYGCAHCDNKVDEQRKPALVPKLAVNEARHQLVVSGTDTITVLTPPVAFVVHLKDVEAPQTAGDSLARIMPWVVPIQQYRPLDFLTRPGLDSILFVQYPVDDSALHLELGQNAGVMDELEAAIGAIRDDARSNELLVSVVGLASIEGPQARNDSLAVRRARSVADALRERTGIARRHFETIGKGEAWDWFKAQLEAAPAGLDAQDVQSLLELIQSIPDPDQRERQIKANPALYAKVKEHLLANQRNAGYIRVYYGNAQDEATQKLNGPIRKLLEQRRYHDAVRAIKADASVMERVQSNPEAANAYGIALYFTALDNKDLVAEDEALGLLKQAARAGSQAAVQNLKGTETYGPARKEYDAWLEALKDNNN